MLEMSDAALAVVQRSHTMVVRAESWLAGELLADDIPIAGGGEDRDTSLAVPERVTLTVPRRDRGVEWDPISPDHPLAAFGQQLRISYGVDVGGSTEWIDRGWFLTSSAETDGDTVNVQLEGLLSLIDEAKLVAPFQPSGTLASTVRSLVEPALTVEFDGTLIDRSVPVGMQWDEDRMGALSEVLDAWPAVPRVTEDGFLRIEPLDDTGDPVLAITDGAGGTVVRWQGASSRDGAFTVVVARGENSDGDQIQGVAYDRSGNSPLRADGPFSPLPVPYIFSSPLLTTVAQCRAAATATLTRLRRTASRRLTVTMVPHPGLITGDVISVTGAGLTNQPCMIEKQALPYSPDTMTLTVRTIDA
ncbi:hypothetical protein SAMN06272781_6899 [Streptomyces sp. 1222.2]|uniref:DUF5047 domain-containing protein n=1 Tax=Streptomyces sp. 1222.2 TaxID=1938833 RepID=UPI000BDC447F|nr:DUF5047 domain-containing protein [Streptomyces sp. 1222.2]SOD80163.1 hypothetical protein SAMN06272781_6899 [Streptomyces sp. 1222.2]